MRRLWKLKEGDFSLNSCRSEEFASRFPETRHLLCRSKYCSSDRSICGRQKLSERMRKIRLFREIKGKVFAMRRMGGQIKATGDNSDRVTRVRGGRVHGAEKRAMGKGCEGAENSSSFRERRGTASSGCRSAPPAVLSYNRLVQPMFPCWRVSP